MNRRQFISAAAFACAAGCTGTSTSTNRSSKSENRTEAERSTPAGSRTKTPESGQAATLRERGVPIRNPGESYALSESVEIRIDRVDFTRTLRIGDKETLSASTEMAVLEAPVYTVSTTGATEQIENPIRPSSWVLQTAHGQYRTLARGDVNAAHNGRDYFLYAGNNNAYSIETSGGSLLFEVPTETTDYSLVLTDYETGNPIVAWTGAVDAADFPTLEITEINAFAPTPDERVQVSVGVENGELATEFFYPTISIESADGTQLTTEKPSFRLDPVESKTLEYTLPVTLEETTELQVDVSPGVKTTVPIVSVRKSWGEWYTMANGVEVKLSSPRTTGRLPSSSDEKEESALLESQEYLAVEIMARNPADWAQRAPALDWFELDASATWRDHRPLDESAYDEPGRENVYQNDSLLGTLYFIVPDSTFATSSNCRGVFPVDENRTEVVEWGPVM